MNKVMSADGTAIVYDRAGQGPAVILVDGALCSRAQGPMPELAKQLASRFTVYNYDRRGRGDSGDAEVYAIEREVEDLAALIEEAGGTAYVYGSSSGAALALEAAAAGLPISKVAAFEAPFVVDGSRKQIPRTWAADMAALAATDRRGDAMVLRENCFGQPLDASQWESVKAPALVVGGGKSPQWMRTSVKAVAAAVPGAEHREIPGQNHMIKATAIAPVLTEFFGGAR
jgi:pimeloyl-ACP methyl ester carboxylesterase